MTTLTAHADTSPSMRGTLSALNKLTLIAALSLLSACADMDRRTDNRFGNSVRIAVAQQVINPDASKNPDKVMGMDGRSAREVLERYRKSYKDPAPHPSVFTIGIGGGGGG
ncbi:MAG: pilus assembly protein [Burkholderiales bacterium]|nr:pilus assembly protein [Burkholderiales bacterium]